MRRLRVLLWLAFGLLVAVVGVIIATFASSAWAPHVVQQVPAAYDVFTDMSPRT